MILWPWPLTLNNNRHLPLNIMVINILYQVVRSWSFRFSLYPAYNVRSFDLQPWKTCWSIVPSCKILELMVQFVSCLQCILPRFPAMWQYDLDLWPPTLKNNSRLPLIMIINCTKFYDPEAHGSFCILLTMYPATFSTMWQCDLGKQ